MHLQTKFNFLTLRIGLVLSLGGLVMGQLTPAGAQTPPPPPPVAPTGPPPPPPVAPTGIAQPGNDRTNFSGEVERFLLNPEGLVEGLILSSGVQVKFPPNMADSLVATVKVGDRVSITGYPGTPSNLGQEVAAYSITNTKTGRTVMDQPPAYPSAPPTNNVNYSNLSVEGTAKRWLVGRNGEINGIILSNGAQVRFPPDIGSQLSNLAKEGVRVQARGFGTTNSYGRTLEATALTVDGQSIAIASPLGGVPPVTPPGALPGTPPGALPGTPPVPPPAANPSPSSLPGTPPVPPPDANPSPSSLPGNSPELPQN